MNSIPNPFLRKLVYGGNSEEPEDQFPEFKSDDIVSFKNKAYKAEKVYMHGKSLLHLLDNNDIVLFRIDPVFKDTISEPTEAEMAEYVLNELTKESIVQPNVDIIGERLHKFNLPITRSRIL